jgi:excisionase family DNA binding protein
MANPRWIDRGGGGDHGKKDHGMPEREFGEPLLTVGEVAGLMRVSNMTVYRLIKSGQLGAIRVGKNYRIRRSDVDRYLTERAVHIEDPS